MIMATRVLYLVSAVLIMATGIYVAVAFTSVLSVNARWMFGLAAVLYFLIQLSRHLIYPLQQPVLRSEGGRREAI